MEETAGEETRNIVENKINNCAFIVLLQKMLESQRMRGLTMKAQDKSTLHHRRERQSSSQTACFWEM